MNVLVTCDVSTLVDGTTPGWVLNRLGGRIRVTAETAGLWVDAHGADTNAFVFDRAGEVVGHGHRQRHATGWLRDAIIARDLHDPFPSSTTPRVV